MRMKLTDCTKADLLWLIKRMCQLNLSERELRIALRDLEFYKEQQRNEKAHQMLKKQQDATTRHVATLQGYGGKPIKDVPMAVLKEADAALAEAKAADKQWRKLMGIKV